jgi:hypothetical protein
MGFLPTTYWPPAYWPPLYWPRASVGIRDALYTVVSAVPRLGNVYRYERWAVGRDEFLTLARYADNGTDKLRIFWIALRSITPERLEFQDGASAGWLRQHAYSIKGWLGLTDAGATEPLALSLATNIMTALNRSAVLHDGQTYYDTTPATLAFFEPRTFYGVLTHYSEIQLTVSDYHA